MYRTVAIPQNESHFIMLENKAANYLKRDKIFCEIGFSAGLTLRYAFKYFKKVYGLDISAKNVEMTTDELLKEGYSNYELYASDLMKYDNRFEKKFDVISFVHGLEHFTQDDYPIIFTNIKKYLKKSGIFTGALPFKQVFNYRMCPECSHVFEIDGHVSSNSLESLSQVFNSNGFKVIYFDNFNFNYLLKNSFFVKRIYHLISRLILRKQSYNQIEYIVIPNF